MDAEGSTLVTEDDRVGALQRLDILGVPVEGRFDRVVRLAQQLFDVRPFAYRTLFGVYIAVVVFIVGNLITGVAVEYKKQCDVYDYIQLEVETPRVIGTQTFTLVVAYSR